VDENEVASRNRKVAGDASMRRDQCCHGRCRHPRRRRRRRCRRRCCHPVGKAKTWTCKRDNSARKGPV